ncbi:hypothetical protein QYF36_013371 [Acer negundo]|nr:hypothetical protein QYF36_013371 [Acer negundo]
MTLVIMRSMITQTRLRHFSRNISVGTRFTNTTTSPLAVFDGEESNESRNQDIEDMLMEESSRSKLRIDEPKQKEFRYLFQISPLTSIKMGLFYSRCTNDMQFVVPRAEKIKGEWRSERIVAEGIGTISKESKKILWGIKKKGYDPLALGRNPFYHPQMNAVIQMTNTVPGIRPSVNVLLVHDTSARGNAPTKMSIHSIKIKEAKQDDGARVEARLGRGRGRSGIPLPYSPACPFGSSFSKSVFGSVHSATRWKHEYEQELHRSTRHAHQRNELSKQLTTREKEVDSLVDKATNGGYFLATLHAAREAPPDFNLRLIHCWDLNQIIEEASAALLRFLGVVLVYVSHLLLSTI